MFMMSYVYMILSFINIHLIYFTACVITWMYYLILWLHVYLTLRCAKVCI